MQRRVDGLCNTVRAWLRVEAVQKWAEPPSPKRCRRMSPMPGTKGVSPAGLHSLKEALTAVFWYKKDLRAFLATSLGDQALVAQLNWEGYKRDVVNRLVDSMAAKPHRYTDQLVDLLLATAEIEDPSWLKRLEDGDEKYRAALVALTPLRKQVEP